MNETWDALEIRSGFQHMPTPGRIMILATTANQIAQRIACRIVRDMVFPAVALAHEPRSQRFIHAIRPHGAKKWAVRKIRRQRNRHNNLHFTSYTISHKKTTKTLIDLQVKRDDN